MDEIQFEKQKFESDIRPLVMLNLIITSFIVSPLLLMSPFWLLNELFFYNNKQHNFWFPSITIVWLISIIFSIQGLKQKKLGKIKAIYLILSFISIWIVIFRLIFH